MTAYTVLLTNVTRDVEVIKHELGAVDAEFAAKCAQELLIRQRLTEITKCRYTRWVLMASGDGTRFPRPVAYGDING